MPNETTRAKYRADRISRRKSATYDKFIQKRRSVEEAWKKNKIRSSPSTISSFSSSSSSSLPSSFYRAHLLADFDRYISSAPTSQPEVEDMISDLSMEDEIGELALELSWNAGICLDIWSVFLINLVFRWTYILFIRLHQFCFKVCFCNNVENRLLHL